MNAVGYVIYAVLVVFIGFMWVRFIAGWVMVFARSWSPQGVVLVVLEAVYSFTDPPIKALDRVIPPLRIGNFVLNLSFLIVFVSAYVLKDLTTAYLIDNS